MASQAEIDDNRRRVFDWMRAQGFEIQDTDNPDAKAAWQADKGPVTYGLAQPDGNPEILEFSVVFPHDALDFLDDLDSNEEWVFWGRFKNELGTRGLSMEGMAPGKEKFMAATKIWLDELAPSAVRYKIKMMSDVHHIAGWILQEEFPEAVQGNGTSAPGASGGGASGPPSHGPSPYG